MFGFKKRCNIAFIGNYLPRTCGIATFTRDLLVSVRKNLNSDSTVFAIAMDEEGKTYNYADEVLYSVGQNKLKDYIEAANIINTSNAQVVSIQHEFGIYGGWDGIYLLSMLSRINIPIVTTLHTVLLSPSPNQKKIITEIAQRSFKTVVMSRDSAQTLNRVYGVPEEKIEIIFHGTPDFISVDTSHFKKRFKLEGRKMILTFGLLSPSKGIETVIRALPPLTKDFPDITYVILGITHPNVLKEQGEKYREGLVRLVERLRLRPHVIFDDRFVKLEELYAWLQASDIYVTPYMNKDQSVSGTLSYAMGAGNAIISTPYRYAEEMLSEGRGVLFDFNDSEKLSAILRDLLSDANKLRSLQKKAYYFGKQMSWKKVSKRYVEVLERAASSKKPETATRARSAPIMRIPKFDLTHIKRLTDDTGIIQHCKFIVPDRSSGYCLDDNARALILCAWAAFLLGDEDAKALLPTYCAFVRHMQGKDGSFANFFSYRREIIDEKGSDDSNGRTVWALGYLSWRTRNETLRSFSREMMNNSFRMIPKLNLRGKAFSAIGLACYLRAFGGDERAIELLKNVSSDIAQAYAKSSEKNWQWFENILAYDNAVIPMSLFNAYGILKDESLLKIAEDSLSFLEQNIFRDGKLSIIGNRGWYVKGKESARFDQQPIDVAAVALAMQSAYRVTGDKEYINKMRTAFDWFLGDNDLGIPMFDTGSKGCSDGLMQGGASMNQGAESTISFLMALLAVLEEHEIESLE